MLQTDRFLIHYAITPAAPEIEQLRRIVKAFSFLPYENLTKILKEAHSCNTREKLRMAPEVFEDHLRWKTGGTCFSLCNALRAVLQESGFQAFIAMADMRYGSNIHCAVIVSLETRRFLLDPGYLLHEPIELPADGEEVRQKTPMNTILLQAEKPNVYSLYTKESGQSKWRYRLRARAVLESEFLQHWIHSFSLNTMENLMISRLDQAGRVYFRKNSMEFVNPSGRKKTILSRGSQISDLSSVFGLPADLILQAQKAILVRP